jgi:hypothetical protein
VKSEDELHLWLVGGQPVSHLISCVGFLYAPFVVAEQYLKAQLFLFTP